MRVSTEQEQITVTVIKIDGKKLSFTQIQRLPIIFGECWLDRYLDNSLVPVGKIPVDIAKSIFRKKLETDRTFHNIDYGLLVNFNNQLFLTLVPYSEEDFQNLHCERNSLKKSWKHTAIVQVKLKCSAARVEATKHQLVRSNRYQILRWLL